MKKNNQSNKTQKYSIFVTISYSDFCSFLQDPNQDETFWNKFGTLGKSKKRAQEVKVVETEGKYAIDSPGMPKSAEMPPEVNTKRSAPKCLIIGGH